VDTAVILCGDPDNFSLVGAPGTADKREMTIVCPKCMHKAADEERVCPRCGTILLTAKQRRDLIHQPSENGNGETANPSGNGRVTLRSRRRSAGSAGHLSPTPVATSLSPDDALRDALEYLNSADERPPTRRRVYQGDPEKERKVNRTWLITIGTTVVLAVGVLAFFLLKGSPPKPATSGTTQTTSSNPANSEIFEFNGAGASTTGPFTTPSAFALTYHVTCTAALKAPVFFTLMHSGKADGQLESNIGNTTEENTIPSFGRAGTFTISVKAPSSCDWTVSGTS
jgi:hypothetical protein